MSDIIFLERQEDNLCENDAITTPGHFLDGSQKKFSILLQAEKMKKAPIKEESRKSKIIKDVVKNKKMNDSFHSEPIVATPVDNKQT